MWNASQPIAGMSPRLRLAGSVGLVGLLVVGLAGFARLSEGVVSQQITTFVTIFMGIFVEAVPFLLAGSLVSGLLEVYVDKGALARFMPHHPVPASLLGALLGFTFPVCECGVVPVTRRLYQKGLPLSVGIAFMLSAPVVNPVVLMSTYAAFGWGVVLWGRFFFTIVIAFAIGLLFSLATEEEILLPATLDVLAESPHHHDDSRRQKFWQACTVGGDDFLDMARYLIVGSMLAALMQTFVPQATLLAWGRGPVISVIILMVLAFVLSICSTVDAFLALSFVHSFTTGSILAFLVFGPMVDVKSSLMFLGVFKRRVVVYLVFLPLLFALVMALLINLPTPFQ